MKTESAHYAAQETFDQLTEELREGLLDANQQLCWILKLYIDCILEHPKNQKILRHVHEVQDRREYHEYH